MSSYLAELIATYGYALVAVIVGLESMGLPVPGETTLVTAAIYAGTTHRLSITFIIAAAIIGAIAGDNIGYAIGRRFGYRLLLRYGHRLRMNAPRIKPPATSGATVTSSSPVTTFFDFRAGTFGAIRWPVSTRSFNGRRRGLP